MNDFELANLLYGSNRIEEGRESATATMYGTAVSDSSDGLVDVVLDGDMTAVLADGTESDNVLTLPTSPAVRSGDNVMVSLVGGVSKTPTVTAVVGSGDRTAATADEAADAAGRAVTETVAEYAVSDDPATAPTGGWSTEAPAYVEGQYTWMRHVVTYGDGRTDTTAAALITGNPGAQGTSVSIASTEVAYQASASGTEAPSGEWSETIPEIGQGQYLWIRTTVVYSPSGSTTSYSVSYHAKDGEAGDDGKMLYGTCSTAAATAAKVASVTGFSLASGATVSIRFTYANTAASPTLNINGLGARKVYTCGVNYAFWSAGAAVTLVYDGTQFHVCSVPVYANTATIGNPGSKNIHIQDDGIYFRAVAAVMASLSMPTSGNIYLTALNNLMLAAGTSSAPKGVYFSVPPSEDGTESDMGFGLTFSGGASTAKFTVQTMDWSVYAGGMRFAVTQLWSGTLSAGGSITVAAFSKYCLFAVKISTNDVLLIGVKNGSYLDCVGSWDRGGSSYTVRASFNVSGSKFTLVSASKHVIDASASGTAVNVTRIYGLF